MEDFLKGIDFDGEIILKELGAWMDGGTITLELVDINHQAFEITICQTMTLGINSLNGTWIPGTFRLNDVEIPIRSDSEKKILNALKALKFSDNIPSKSRPLERELINSRIAFVESQEYLKIATQMGRL